MHCESENARAPRNTPIAHALRVIRDKDLSSFHALPLSNGAALRDSPLRQEYHDLFGGQLFQIEQTVSGELFDSFFFPSGVIAEAEALAAETFGADGTLFVTSGTTVANQIAVAALCRPGDKVLVDRRCHQSIHFPLKSLSAWTDYLAPAQECPNTGRSFWSLSELVQRAVAAEKVGTPYATIVLSASSYDGIVYDIPMILAELLRSGVSTRKFLIDEAWGIGNYFLEGMAERTAMAARRLLKDYPDLVVLATQSAHKSLAALRQASMLHYLGPPSMAETLRNVRFKIHTTSPSYPILASLDLARAQVQESGLGLFAAAVENAETFQRMVVCDPGLSFYHVNHFKHPGPAEPHVRTDPTKVSLNLSRTRLSPQYVRNELYGRYGIYVNRFTENSLLFHFHIGTSAETTAALAAALKEIQLSVSQPESDLDEFIITYPPGIPIAVPGDAMTNELRGRIRTLTESGNLLFRV